VGQQLTIAQDPRNDATEIPRDRVAGPRDRVAPQRLIPQIVQPIIDDDGVSPVADAASGGALSVVDVSWSAVAVDSEELIATLRGERSASRAGFDHPHAVSDCAFCRRAAASYR
jgi:hypothetical protein